MLLRDRIAWAVLFGAPAALLVASIRWWLMEAGLW